LYNLFSVCKERGCFVYEQTDLFGKKLTVSEIEFWGAYNIIQNAQFFKVDYRNMTFQETIDGIHDSKRKQVDRMNRVTKK
jgi:hypothetical protein